MPPPDREVADLERRPPAGLAAVLWLNALASAAIGGGFAWAALHPWLGGASGDLSASTLFGACGLACICFAGWLVWMWRRESRERLLVDGDGIALRTRGRSRHAWADIERFEVGRLRDEGVEHAKDGDGHCGVIVLRSGVRVALRALRTDAPFAACEREEIVEQVQMLNELHRARRPGGGTPTVLESGARC